MIYGYARVSTLDQNLDLQIQKLGAVCDKVFKEKASGKKSDRPELNRLLESVQEGDEVVVFKLDRLGRSLRDLIDIVNRLNEKKVGFRCLEDETIDTTSPQGRFIFHIFGALAEFERELIRERTQAGLSAARARGKLGGRPKGLSKEAEKSALMAASLYESTDPVYTTTEICTELNISRGTLYKYLRHRKVQIGAKTP